MLKLLVYSSNGLGKVLLSFSTVRLTDSVILHRTENGVDAGLVHGHVLCALHFCTTHKARKAFTSLMEKKRKVYFVAHFVAHMNIYMIFNFQCL